MTRNVILVVVDALRADRVGVLSDSGGLTPHVDRLAREEGVVFENAYSCTNTTDPSVTSIHSGRDPYSTVKHHGPYVPDEEKRRIESVSTIPELLQQADIETIATGRLLSRWHKSGFGKYPESALSRNRRRAMGERLEMIHPHLRSIAGWLYEGVASRIDFGDEDDAIDRFLQLSAGSDQFYGFIHLMDTHAPYEPDEELVEELLERREYPRQDLAEFFDQHRDNDYVQEFVKEHATDADYEYGLGRLIAKYDATVVEADRKIGRLVDVLRSRGEFEETTILVTSDHGESLDEHGIYFDHHGLYDQSVHVPLVVSGPETTSQRREEFVQLYDLAPTILQLFGLDADVGGQGRSLWPLLTEDREWEKREYVVSREAHAQSRVAIRTADWKYIKHVEDAVLERERGSSLRCGYCNRLHGAAEELYDLTTDQAEADNVAGQHPEKVAELDEKLDAYHQSLEVLASDDEAEVEYSEESEVLERLEDLGYR